MNHYDIILFYKVAEIDDPEGFASRQREFCTKEGLLGKILVAREGINGSFSGTREQIDKYKSFLTSIEGFMDVNFKEETASFRPFRKLIVRVKKEIIRLEREVDMGKRGKYITPEELLALYGSGEDFSCSTPGTATNRTSAGSGTPLPPRSTRSGNSPKPSKGSAIRRTGRS
jgi:predicted sulfurtransferase